MFNTLIITVITNIRADNKNNSDKQYDMQHDKTK